MAGQDQRPQQQQQQARQAAATIDPYEDPIAYVKAHGFKPLGPADWESTLWIDGSKPMFGEEHYEPKFAPFLRRNERTGRVEAVMEQVMANDGTGKQMPVKQLTYTPPPEPVTLQAALRMVMNREHRKQVDAERAKNKVA